MVQKSPGDPFQLPRHRRLRREGKLPSDAGIRAVASGRCGPHHLSAPSMRVLLALFALLVGLPLSQVARATSQAEVAHSACQCASNAVAAKPQRATRLMALRSEPQRPAVQRAMPTVDLSPVLAAHAAFLSDRPLE